MDYMSSSDSYKGEGKEERKSVPTKTELVTQELFEQSSEKVPDTLTSKGLADLDRLGRGGGPALGPYIRSLIRLAAAELYRYRLAESRAQRRRDLVKQIEERQEELRRLTMADMKEGK